jgi:broad specificity phosphatase PhoE
VVDELWVVRHGQTEWSRDGRHTSVTDLPLTDHGSEQARMLVPLLAGVEFTLVVTSPRRRAVQTARLAGFEETASDGDVAEWAYGDLEGRTSAAMREEDPSWSLWTHGAPGGETPEQVSARMDRFIKGVDGVPGRVLVFSHGHASRALAARWLGRPVADGGMFSLDTATVSVLGHEHGRRAVTVWNSTGAPR